MVLEVRCAWVQQTRPWEAREAGPGCLIPCPGTGVKGAVQINTLDVAKRRCRGGTAGPCTFSPEARNSFPLWPPNC